MSAAEPADPTRTYTMNTGAAGAVIDITRRLPKGARPAEGRWTQMVTPPRPTPSDPGAGGETAREFAEHIETVFNALDPRRTLTDDDTTLVYLTTLEIVTRLLQGARAQGIVDEQQLTKLDQLMDGLRDAPNLV